MYSETTVLELIELIYRAAGDQNCWPTLLQRLGQVFEANGCSVHHHQIPSEKSNFSGEWNVDPGAINEYTSYYGLRNIWRSFRRHLFFPGSVNVSQAMCPEDVFLQCEYYNDFLRRYELFHCIVATLQDDTAQFSNLTIFRPKNKDVFGDEEVKLLRVLTPHLVRAFQLHNQIQGLERKASIFEHTLNQLRSAVVLVDAGGHAVFANQAATSLFQRQRYIRLTSAGIEVARIAEHKQLARLIDGAARTGVSLEVAAGGTMCVSRDFHRPLHVLVCPLRTLTLCVGNAMPVAIVFITDPELSPQVPAERLRHLYGLTPAESRLAQLLTSGFNLRECSERLQVKQSTVRSQLNTIFAKTRSSRQSELVRLLLMGPTDVFLSASTA
jgi:DNA-binding CsgD family transcriptional regulator/PAS domain-containing protein